MYLSYSHLFIFSGDGITFSMPINDSISRSDFVGAISMEKAIYDNGEVNFYAPFYRQAGLNCYSIRGYDNISSDSDVNNACELAYKKMLNLESIHIYPDRNQK